MPEKISYEDQEGSNEMNYYVETEGPTLGQRAYRALDDFVESIFGGR